jgi:hypothetical protein
MTGKYKIIAPKGASWDYMRNEVFKDTLDIMKITRDHILLDLYLDEVLEAIKDGPCLLIIDSIVTNGNTELYELIKKINGGVLETDSNARFLAKEAKKNPQCRTILLTVQAFDMQPNEVDVYIDGKDHDSYEQIQVEVKKFVSQFS